MSGGSATHAGIGFQDKVAGWLAVHILSDEPIQFLGLPMRHSKISARASAWDLECKCGKKQTV